MLYVKYTLTKILHKDRIETKYEKTPNLWEKAMATPSSTLAWKIPWTEDPGRLQFMGSQRVGHD